MARLSPINFTEWLSIQMALIPLRRDQIAIKAGLSRQALYLWSKGTLPKTDHLIKFVAAVAPLLKRSQKALLREAILAIHTSVMAPTP